MFSTEQRRIAIETFIRFDHSYADTIAELGYPTRHSLRAWHKDCLEHGEVRPPKRQREPRLALGMRQAAVDCCLAHGKSLARTMRRMGYPASRECLCGWTDELAPGQRKYRGPNPKAGPVPLAEKIQAVAEPGSRSGTAAQVAEKHGVPRTAPYAWRRETMGGNGGDTEGRGVPVSREHDGLPDDAEALQDMLREARMQLGKVQPGPGVRQATLETAKEGQGADPELLTNEEKAAMAEAPRAKVRIAQDLYGDRFAVVVVGLSEKQIKQVKEESERIVALPKTDTQKELAEAYTAADVFFNPTVEDNYPTVNLEAEACGTPVVTYDTGGCAETVRDVRSKNVKGYHAGFAAIQSASDDRLDGDK